MSSKPLFEVTETGCIVPFQRKLNWDGYYRVPSPTRTLKNGKKARVMFHRLVWELEYGAIPKGYSLHHTCRNRACCNIEHLVLLSKSEHAKLHNHERYAFRKEKAKDYWLEHPKVTGTALGEMFGVSFSIGCRWIREWKAQRLSLAE